MGLFMIDENKLLAWLQGKYTQFHNDEENHYRDSVCYANYGKMDLIQGLLIEIKQGRFNENQTKDV